MWIARNKSTCLWLHLMKPYLDGDEYESDSDCFLLPNTYFPELSFEDGPIEVEFKVKTKGKTKELINVLLGAINRIPATVEYGGWSDSFAREQNKEAIDDFRKEVNKLINWDELTEEDCELLRFAKWEDGNPLRLIPLCFLHCLPDGLELTCIDGRKVIVGKDRIDNNVRCGCIAYGIIPKDCKQQE